MKQPTSVRKNAFIISFTYAALGVCWVVITDWKLYELFKDNSYLFAEFEAYKGAFFILASAALIHLVSFKVLRRQHQTDFALSETEKRYRSLVKNLPVGVYYTNPDGKFTYMNARCAELLGLQSTNALGDAWQDHLADKDRLRVIEQKRVAQTDENLCVTDYTLVHSDLRKITVIDTSRPEHDDDGKLIGFMGTLTDFSAATNTSKLLDESNARFNALVRHSQTGIFLVKDEGVVFANPRTAAMFGVSNESLMSSQSIFDFLDCQNSSEFRAQLFQCQHTPGYIFSFKLQMQNSTRDTQDLEFLGIHSTWEGEQTVLGTISPVCDEAMRPSGDESVGLPQSENSNLLPKADDQRSTPDSSSPNAAYSHPQLYDELLVRIHALSTEERMALLVLLRK